MTEPRSFSRARRAVGTLVALAGFGSTAAIVCGFAADMWWWFELLASWRSVLGIGLALLLLIEGAFFRRGRVAILLLAGAGLGVGSCLPFYFSGVVPGGAVASKANEIDSVKTTLRPIQIAWGNTPGGRENLGLEALIASGAEVVVATEVGSAWSAEGLAKLGGGAYRVVYRDLKRGEMAILVLARIPIADVERLDMAGGAAALDVSFSWEGKPWRMLALHLQSPKSVDMFAKRNENLLAAAEWSKRVGRIASCVVVGDLNTTPFSPAFSRFMEVGGLVDSMPGFGLQGTWPVVIGDSALQVVIAGLSFPVFSIPIDHCLYSRDLACWSRRVLSLPGSDHGGLAVELGRKRIEH